MNVSILNSPIGKLCIVGDSKIRKIVVSNMKSNPSSVTENAKKQLEEYFQGIRKEFDFEIELEGTKFSCNTYKELLNVPFGSCITYGELSEKIFGNRKYSRAVGNALNKNSLLIVVPCHRVVSGTGIGGFGLGVNTKKKLLSLESVNI